MTIKINLTKGPFLNIAVMLKISWPAELLAGNKIIEKFKKVKEESKTEVNSKTEIKKTTLPHTGKNKDVK